MKEQNKLLALDEYNYQGELLGKCYIKKEQIKSVVAVNSYRSKVEQLGLVMVILDVVEQIGSYGQNIHRYVLVKRADIKHIIDTKEGK